MSKSKKSADQVEARPVGQGKDPLAEGNTLENPTNTEAETHYNVKEKSEDVQAREAENTINGQDANERAEEHNAQSLPASDVPNSDAEEQDEVAAGREEPGEELPETPEQEPEDTPEVPESDDAEETPSVPELPEDDEADPAEEQVPEAPADEDSEKPDGTDTEEDPLAEEANDKAAQFLVHQDSVGFMPYRPGGLFICAII